MSRERIIIITSPPPPPPGVTETVEFKFGGTGTPLPEGTGEQYCLGVEAETGGGLSPEQKSAVQDLLVQTVEALHGIVNG